LFEETRNQLIAVRVVVGAAEVLQYFMDGLNKTVYGAAIAHMKFERVSRPESYPTTYEEMKERLTLWDEAHGKQSVASVSTTAMMGETLDEEEEEGVQETCCVEGSRTCVYLVMLV